MNGDVTNARSPARRLRIEHALVLAGLVGLFCLLFGASFHADFSVIEEHRIVEDSQRTMSQWLDTMISEDVLTFGRVKPVYFFFHFGKILLLGASPHALHLATTGLGVLTCFLFYVAARGVGADILSALVFILLFAVTGDQSTIWYLIFSPAETFGMFLTAVAVWALVRAAARAEPSSWNAVALVATALAGLAKESFILIIPALLLLRWILACWFGHNRWRPALRKLRGFLLAGAAVFAIELLAVAVVMLSRPASYGANIAGLSRASFDPRTWYSLLVSPGLASLSVYGAAGAMLLLIYGCWPNHRRARPYLLAVTVATVAWLVPQLVLYRQGMSAHYLYPAIVAPAAVVGLALSVLWRRPHWITRAAWVAAVVSLFPLFSRGIAVETERVSRYTADALVVGEIVSYSRENVAPGHAIIIAADPSTPYGFSAPFALSTYLKAAGSPSPIYLWPVLDPARRTSLHMAAAREAETTFEYPKTLGTSDVGAIIVLMGPTGIGTVPAWFADAQWRELVFRKPYYVLNLDAFGYVRLGYVTHRVLVRGEEAPGIPSDSPLVMVDPSLRGRVGINPLLRTPWWGVEQYGSGPLLWLGDGVDGEMTVMLWSAEQQSVQVTCEVLAGPTRRDSRRTVELTISSRATTTTARQTFDRAGILTFPGVLHRGRNEIRLAVLDTASVRPRPSEDLRPLLVQLRRMTVGAPPRPLGTGVAFRELDERRPGRQPGH